MEQDAASVSLSAPVTETSNSQTNKVLYLWTQSTYFCFRLLQFSRETVVENTDEGRKAHLIFGSDKHIYINQGLDFVPDNFW